MAFPDASRSSLNCSTQLSCVDLSLLSVVLVLPTGSGPCPVSLAAVLEVFVRHRVGAGEQQLSELGLLLL